MYSRCTASSNDLDGCRYLCRSSPHTEMLGLEFKLGTLWDEYGLVSDVIVNYIFSRVHALLVLIRGCDFCSAIHKHLSSSRYSWTLIARSAAPADKRSFQGSYSHMDNRLHQGEESCTGGKSDIRWYWLPVSFLVYRSIKILTTIQHCVGTFFCRSTTLPRG